MQEKEEEKKIWKTTKAPGESKTLQQFKTQITQICLSVCLSVCLHTFISFACESKTCWKVYSYSKSSKRAESPFFCCILTQRIWTMEMHYAKGEWNGKNCCYSRQQLPTTAAKKSWFGKAHSSWLPKQDTSDCNSSCSSKLSIFCKVACLKIASALDYQTRTTTQKVGGMELESWSWGWEGREMDDDPFLKKNTFITKI